MNDIIWKAFKLSDNFYRQTPPSTNMPAKELNISDVPFDNSIALITRAESNNGIKGYIQKGEFPTLKNKITYNDQFSLFLFHNYEFTTIKDHLSIFVPKNDYLKQLLDYNPSLNVFLINILNYIFSKDIFNFNFTGADYKFDRELILLPCLEVGKDDEYIWEENGHYYTLAVEYIKKLMDEAKELREQKTIRLYEAERAKYEAERAKYEAGYKREKDLLVWKSFALGTLFGWSSRKDLALKNYNKIDHYEDGYVEVVTGSKDDKNDFISFDELPKNYPTYQDCLCLNTNGSIGYCLYYDRPIISPTSSVHILLHKYEKLKKLMTIQVNGFFSKVISNIFTNGIYNRTACLISDEKFAREIILLPCLEVGKDDEYIWEENGHYYTLAVEYISYIYLTGKMENSQKKIDNYTYQY